MTYQRQQMMSAESFTPGNSWQPSMDVANLRHQPYQASSAASSPVDTYFSLGSRQSDDNSAADTFAASNASLTPQAGAIRPSTGLSLNMASLDMHSATPSPLTGIPPGFSAGEHQPQQIHYDPQPAPPSHHLHHTRSTDIFTFNVPSPNNEWTDAHHGLSRSQSSSSLFASASNPTQASQAPQSSFAALAYPQSTPSIPSSSNLDHGNPHTLTQQQPSTSNSTKMNAQVQRLQQLQQYQQQFQPSYQHQIQARQHQQQQTTSSSTAYPPLVTTSSLVTPFLSTNDIQPPKPNSKYVFDTLESPLEGDEDLGLGTTSSHFQGQLHNDQHQLSTAYSDASASASAGDRDIENLGSPIMEDEIEAYYAEQTRSQVHTRAGSRGGGDFLRMPDNPSASAGVSANGAGESIEEGVRPRMSPGAGVDSGSNANAGGGVDHMSMSASIESSSGATARPYDGGSNSVPSNAVSSENELDKRAERMAQQYYPRPQQGFANPSTPNNGAPGLVNVKREIGDTPMVSSFSSNSPSTVMGGGDGGPAGSEPGRPGTSKGGSGGQGYVVNNFVAKLFGMISDPRSATFIGWNTIGTSFVVSNCKEFSRLVLGSHFKHNNFSSFVRQLNMYGFHKINRTPRSVRAHAEDQVWEFSHPKFLRGRSDLLEDIKRRNPEVDAASQQTSRASAPPTPTPLGFPNVPTRVDLPIELHVPIQNLQRENAGLKEELNAERARREQLTSVVEDLYEFVKQHVPAMSAEVSLPPFPRDLFELIEMGDDEDEMGNGDSAPGITVTSPSEPTPPGTMFGNLGYPAGGASSIVASSMSQDNTMLHKSPSSSPTNTEFPPGIQASVRLVPSVLGGSRAPSSTRMSIPVLPRYDSSGAINQKAPGSKHPSRKSSLQLSQLAISSDAGGEGVGESSTGHGSGTDSPNHTRGNGAKRKRLDEESFVLNIASTNASFSELASSSPSPSTAGATFSGPPSSISSTTPGVGGFPPEYGFPSGSRPPSMSIVIPTAPSLTSPRSTSRLHGPPSMNYHGAHHNQTKTLLRARSDSAPHGNNLGHLWRVNVDNTGMGDSQRYMNTPSGAGSTSSSLAALSAASGRPRAGTQHSPYPTNHHLIYQHRTGVSGGITRSPSRGSFGGAGASSSTAGAFEAALQEQHEYELQS